MSMFWPSQSKALIEALVAHERSLDVDAGHFTKVLKKALTWETNSIFHPIYEENNSPQESGNNSLLLDGLIYNMRANQAFRGIIPFNIHADLSIPKRNIVKNAYKLLFPSDKEYSVDEVLNNIYTNEDMVRILMSQPATPYTLLGRLQSFSSDGSERYSVSTRPVLVKPGVSSQDEQRIYQWEIQNIKMQTHKRLGQFSFS